LAAAPPNAFPYPRVSPSFRAKREISAETLHPYGMRGVVAFRIFYQYQIYFDRLNTSPIGITPFSDKKIRENPRHLRHPCSIIFN
jgi:hypothetical protein